MKLGMPSCYIPSQEANLIASRPLTANDALLFAARHPVNSACAYWSQRSLERHRQRFQSLTHALPRPMKVETEKNRRGISNPPRKRPIDPAKNTIDGKGTRQQCLVLTILYLQSLCAVKAAEDRARKGSEWIDPFMKT